MEVLKKLHRDYYFQRRITVATLSKATPITIVIVPKIAPTKNNPRIPTMITIQPRIENMLPKKTLRKLCNVGPSYLAVGYLSFARVDFVHRFCIGIIDLLSKFAHAGYGDCLGSKGLRNTLGDCCYCHYSENAKSSNYKGVYDLLHRQTSAVPEQHTLLDQPYQSP